MTDITLTARCHPTEDREKIVSAILKLFPDAQAEGEDPIVARAHSTDTFVEQIGRQRIRDAARSVLRKGMRDGRTSFRLNKQVATVGKVSFAEEVHALGDIDVTIESEDISALIDDLAPDTRRERKQ